MRWCAADEARHTHGGSSPRLREGRGYPMLGTFADDGCPAHRRGTCITLGSVPSRWTEKAEGDRT
ncbi:hypothetical protein B0H10DRAFT_2139329 [Mycena sp. CBHHK59/15]|nr:hypothetical protein B0H10DRAFT_2139329 [Mycena sp. CBHHK59/15]